MLSYPADYFTILLLSSLKSHIYRTRIVLQQNRGLRHRSLTSFMLAVYSELSDENFCPDNLVPMNNIDSQNQSSLDSTNGSNNTIHFYPPQLMVSDADSQLLTENANTGFDIANEIKRWQQLHQSSNNGTASTALLSNVGTNLQHDSSSATAFLQQVIDSQQQQNQRGTSNRFDLPLTNSLTLSGSAIGQLIGTSNDISNGTNDLFNSDGTNTVSGSNGSQFAVNLNVPGTFYTDPRLLMVQQAVAMNFPSFSNTILFPQAQQQNQQQQQQQPIFPQLPTLQQQDDTNTLDDLPLPSPHSLFHRDGTRRMRGGVIEPFPVSTREGVLNALVLFRAHTHIVMFCHLSF